MAKNKFTYEQLRAVLPLLELLRETGQLIIAYNDPHEKNLSHQDDVLMICINGDAIQIDSLVRDSHGI